MFKEGSENRGHLGQQEHEIAAWNDAAYRASLDFAQSGDPADYFRSQQAAGEVWALEHNTLTLNEIKRSYGVPTWVRVAHGITVSILFGTGATVGLVALNNLIQANSR